MHTCEQRVIELSGYYITVIAGQVCEDAVRGVGRVIERYWFWQYVPEGV